MSDFQEPQGESRLLVAREVERQLVIEAMNIIFQEMDDDERDSWSSRNMETDDFIWHDKLQEWRERAISLFIDKGYDISDKLDVELSLQGMVFEALFAKTEAGLSEFGL